jgi:hypothetical protein
MRNNQSLEAIYIFAFLFFSNPAGILQVGILLHIGDVLIRARWKPQVSGRFASQFIAVLWNAGAIMKSILRL